MSFEFSVVENASPLSRSGSRSNSANSAIINAVQNLAAGQAIRIAVSNQDRSSFNKERNRISTCVRKQKTNGFQISVESSFADGVVQIRRVESQ